ncbi:MAG: DUF3617 domain-containing protein [Syntrophales bacterium]
MIKRSLVLATAVSLIFTVAAFAAPNYQEGLWEITTTTNMPGVPKEMMHPVKNQICMTKQNAIPQQPQQKGEQQCKMANQRTVGSKVFWTMTCKGGTVINGEITYSKTSFDGAQTTTTSQGGKLVTVKSTMSGKYIGPCTK